DDVVASAPASWGVSSGQTITVAAAGPNLVVSDASGSSSRPLAAVSSLAVAGGGELVLDLAGGPIPVPVSYAGPAVSTVSGAGSSWSWDGGAGSISGGGISSASFTGVGRLSAGGAHDALHGPAADSTWTVSGPGSGTVGAVAFFG